MQEKVIIFGNQELAELAHYYLTVDSPYEVIAFTANKTYRKDESFKGLPFVDFENLENLFPPSNYKLFAPIYVKEMNQFREKIFLEGQKKGYKFISYISSKALTWNSKIGDNCFIFEGCNIQPFSKIEDNVIIWSFSHVGHHSLIKANNFISGNVVIAGKCLIESYCFIGTNSSLRDGITIHKGTLVGMDASVISDTEEWSVYQGVPAKKYKNKKSTEVY